MITSFLRWILKLFGLKVSIKVNILAWKIKLEALPTRFNISRRDKLRAKFVLGGISNIRTLTPSLNGSTGWPLYVFSLKCESIVQLDDWLKKTLPYDFSFLIDFKDVYGSEAKTFAADYVVIKEFGFDNVDVNTNDVVADEDVDLAVKNISFLITSRFWVMRMF
ncbi:hypothetical protein Tco_1320228 [Tanacetum coccineum]